MSLSELMVQRLDRMPRVRTRTPTVDRALGVLNRVSYRRIARLNALSDVRIMSRTKPVYVDSSNLLAPKDSFVIYKDVYVFEYGTKSLYHAKYIYDLRTPGTARVRQSMGEVAKTVRVIFPTRGYYELDIEYPITKPENVTCKSEITRMMRGDSQTKTYALGLFDSSLKPVSEYPVSGADNAELTLSYSWEDKNFVYPTPIPSGLTITDMNVKYVSGWCLFKGRYYKDPSTNNQVRLSWTLTNNMGKTITARHWGVPVSVLYEDGVHVSQVNADVSVPTQTILNGSSARYSFTVNLPTWAYGHVCVAHAVRVFEDSMITYAGGPCFQFTVGRLRLP
jgi:hypothetical protein